MNDAKSEALEEEKTKSEDLAKRHIEARLSLMSFETDFFLYRDTLIAIRGALRGGRKGINWALKTLDDMIDPEK